MAGRFRLAAALLLVTLPCATQASDQTAALVQAFASLCTGDSDLDFKAIDARADAMRLQPHHEKTPDDGVPGYFKSWSLPGKENVEELNAIQAKGAKGVFNSCGLTAMDVNGDDFKEELTKALRLGDPRDETTSPDGTRRALRWEYGAEGAGMQLMMVDSTPKGKPGVNLTLIQADMAKAQAGQSTPAVSAETPPTAPQATAPAAPTQQ